MTKRWKVGIGCVLGVVTLIVGIMAWHTYKTTEIIKEDTIRISRFAAEEIVRLEIEDEEAYRFTKQNELWHNEAYPSLLYDEDVMRKLVNQISSLVAHRTIENVQDLSVYGIDESSRRIAVYNEALEIQTLLIGAEATEDKAYYVWYQEEEVLAVVPKGKLDYILSDARTWIRKDIEIPTIEMISDLKVSNTEESLLHVSKEIDQWIIQKPFNNIYKANNQLIEDYIKDIDNITKDLLVEVLDNNEKEFGLDKPSLVIEVDNEILLTFGADKNGNTYFTYKNEPYIYQVNNQKVKDLTDIERNEWVNKILCKPDRALLEFIEVKYLDELYKIETVGDTSEEVENILTALFEMTMYGPVSNPSREELDPREAEASITYVYLDGSRKTIEFIPYDPSLYLLRENGYVEFSAEKKQLMDLINALRELEKNK